MLAYANDPEAFNNFEKFAYLSFFSLLEPLKKGWQILVLILVTCLCASSVDSLQNALACVFSQELEHQKQSGNWVRLVVIAFNIPAVIQVRQRC